MIGMFLSEEEVTEQSRNILSHQAGLSDVLLGHYDSTGKLG